MAQAICAWPAPLPRQLARLLAVTGTDQVLAVEDATAGNAAE
ncbi:hypothetical protein ACFWSF_34445 [Streptomyces sp. NPDC058611]